MNFLARMGRLWLSSWKSVPADAVVNEEFAASSAKTGNKLFSFINSFVSSSSMGVTMLTMTLTTTLSAASITYDIVLDSESPLAVQESAFDSGIVTDESGNFLPTVTIDEQGNIVANTAQTGRTQSAPTPPMSLMELKQAVINPDEEFTTYEPWVPDAEWLADNEEWLMTIDNGEWTIDNWQRLDSDSEPYLPVFNPNSPPPEVITTPPEVTTPEPEVTTAPQETTTPPHPTPTPPHTTPTPPPPEVTTPAPEVTTPAPEVTTAPPEVTTPAPEVTTAPPEVTTPAPEVTTTPPTTTTPAPEVTTAPPTTTTTTPPTVTPPTTNAPPPSTTTTPPVTTTPTPDPEPQTITLSAPDNQTEYIFGHAPIQLILGDGSGTGQITYTSSDEDVISVSDSGFIAFNHSGTATITVTKAACANYLSASASLTLTVGARSMDNAAITITSVHVYDGTEHTPAFSVTDGTSPNLITSGDYTVSFIGNRINTGTVMLILTGQGNYTGTASQTFNIDQRPLTINFTADNKTYDRSTAAAITGRTIASGLITGDDVTVTGGTAVFADMNVANNITVTATGFTLSGTHASNYTIGTINTTTADITPKTLTITGVTAIDRNYDGTASVMLSGGTLQGVESGDTVNFTLGTGSVTNPNAEDNKAVTTAITLDNNNYTLTQPTDITVNITPLPITITPNSGQSKIRHEADPVFTFTHNPALIGNDTFTGALGREVGETVGIYAFTLGDLSAGSNYTLSLGGSATFAITIAAPDYTIPTGLTATYGDLLSSVALPQGWAWDFPLASVGGAGVRNHSATFTPTDTANYNPVTRNLEITVAKANQTGFSINNPGTLTFGQAPVQLTTTGGQAGTVTWVVTSGNAAHIAANTGYISIERAGEVTITATRAGDDNYNAVSVYIDLTIGKRDLSNVSIAEVTGLVYTGLAQAPIPNVTDGISPNLITTDDFTVSHSNNTNAGTATVTITATAYGNYRGTHSRSFTIAPAPLTVTADNLTKEFNAPIPTLTYTIAGFVNGETAAIANVTGTAALSTDYNLGDPAENYTITAAIGTLHAPNYEFTVFNNGTLSVGLTNQAALSITNIPAIITYGDSLFTLGTSGGSTGGTVTWAVTDGDGAVTINANTGDVMVVHAGTATIRATMAGNNNFNAVTAYTTLTVTPRTITMAMFTINSVVYDGNPHSPNITSTILSQGTDYEFTFTPQTNVGDYSVTIGGLGNYDGSVTLTFSITRAMPTASHLSFSLAPVTFDGNTHSVSVTTNEIGMGAITVLYNGSATAPTNAGTYQITVDIAEGSNFTARTLTLGDFTITQAATGFGTPSAINTTFTPTLTLADLTLDPGYTWDVPTTPLTVADSGQAFPATYQQSINHAPVSGTITVNVAKAAGTAITDTVTVTFSPTLTVGGAVSAFNDYTFANASTALTVANSGIQVTGYKDNADPDNYEQDSIIITITINPANISSAVINVTSNHVYNSTAHMPTYTVMLDGVTPTFTAEYSNNTSAGQATITLTGTVNYTGTASQNFTIDKANQAALTITNPGNKAFGDAAFNLEATGGSGDGAITFTSSNPAILSISGNTATIHAQGTVTITAVRAESANHLESSPAEFILTIGRKSISTASINITSNHVYNGLLQTPSYTVVLDGVTLNAGTDFTVETPADNINAVTGTLTIEGAGNYTGIASGNFTISPRELTITGFNISKQFDDTNTVSDFETLSFAGLQNNETAYVDYSAVTATYNNAVIGTGKAITFSGNFAITAGTANPDNYTLTQPTGITGAIVLANPSAPNAPTQGSKTSTSVTLAAPTDTNPLFALEYGVNTGDTPPTVWQDGLQFTGLDQGETYFFFARYKANPDRNNVSAASTYLQITPYKLDQTALTVSGVPTTLTYGDAAFSLAVSGGSGGGVLNYEVTSGTAVSVNSSGLVTITGAGSATIRVTKATDDVYNEAYATVNLTVEKAPLTITANNRTITYGDEVPNNFSVTYSGFVGSDTEQNYSFTGALSVTSPYTQWGNAGNYAITPSGFDSTNYNITFQNGTLTVNPFNISAGINLTFPGAPFTYDGTAQVPVLTVTTGSDNIHVPEDMFTAAYSNNTIGTATVNITGSGNFTGTASGNFTIDPRPLTVGFSAADKPYDGNTSATVTSRTIISGLVSGDNVTVTGGTAVFAGINVNTGITVTATGFTLEGTHAGNYTIETINTTTADITPRQLLLEVTLNSTDMSPIDTSMGMTVNVGGLINPDTATVTLNNPPAGITFDSTANTLTYDGIQALPDIAYTLSFTASAGTNYADSTVTRSFYVEDGQAAGLRAIRVTQENITRFNTYANTTAGLTRHYILAGNVNLNGITWTPIGSTTPFTGTFYGDGNTISNLTLTATAADNQGMFGVIGTGGKVTNLSLINVNITGSSQSVGGIAGASSGHIEHIFVSGNISGRSMVGGIVGTHRTGGTIAECYADIAVSVDDVNNPSQRDRVGGIAGNNEGTIITCFVMGTVSSRVQAGGIAGVNENGGHIEDNVSLVTSVTIATGTTAGRIIGLITGSPAPTQTNNFARFDVGGSTAQFNAKTHDGKDGADLTAADTWNSLGGFDQIEFFQDKLPDLNDFLPPIGSGTAADPWRIYNEADLRAVGTGTTHNGGVWALDSHYKMEASITLNAGDPNNWTPIGNIGAIGLSNQFTGTFNGSGHTIHNMTVVYTGQNLGQGMFGHIGGGGVVENVTLANVNINSGTSTSGAGGIAGTNDGTIKNCEVDGEIRGGNFVGGIADSNTGTIENCLAKGTVFGSPGDTVGGITGQNNGTIHNCIATNTVTGGNYIGGIAGRSGTGTIKNSVALNTSITTTYPGFTANCGIIAGSFYDLGNELKDNYSPLNLIMGAAGRFRNPSSVLDGEEITIANHATLWNLLGFTGNWWGVPGRLPDLTTLFPPQP